ncbi:ATP-binding protein [Rhodospirillum sp. A1_3_36]|uniref:ATP-binding protein n=1 Tax=Rhodospirillum sp. A1_3_36 TaxID=3391666 RepID=UPI0039A48027
MPLGMVGGSTHQRETSRRTLIGLASLVLLAFNSAIVGNLLNEREQALQSARESARTIVAAVREQTSATVFRINVSLTDLASALSPQADGALWADASSNALIKNQMALLPMVRAIVVTDASGRLIQDHNTPTPVGMDLSDRDYVIAHAKEGIKGLFIGRPMRGRSTGQWFLSMSRAIEGPDGTFQGVVAAVVDPSALGQAYAGMDLSEKGAITLFRTDGVLLTRAPDYQRFIGTDQGTSSLFQTLVPSARKGVVLDALGIDGQNRIIAWSHLDDWPLVMTVSLDRQTLLSAWRHRIPYHIIAMTVVSAVILTLILLVGRQISSLNGLVADLSRRENELIAANESITMASRAKTQFLAKMSHELRPPLNAIIGFSDILTAGIHGPLMTRQKKFVGDIHLSALQLLNLMNDILDVAKIESGSYALHDQTLNLSEILTAARRVVMGKIEEKQLELDSACVDPDCWVLGDERALNQIVLNLLSNAVKFTPEKGKITLSIVRNGEGGLILTVADTGIGIPQEHLDLVLCPFHQVDRSDTHRQDGTGLGLPLAKALVEKHGGTLQLESQLGRGTRVSVILPAQRILTVGLT